ncbi:hypothetical protein GCM10023325_03820 [Sphingomonas lutea]
MQSDVDALRFKASKCRDLATDALTSDARVVLNEMALQYEEDARTLELAAAKSSRTRRAFSWPLG